MKVTINHCCTEHGQYREVSTGTKWAMMFTLAVTLMVVLQSVTCHDCCDAQSGCCGLDNEVVVANSACFNTSVIFSCPSPNNQRRRRALSTTLSPLYNCSDTFIREKYIDFASTCPVGCPPGRAGFPFCEPCRPGTVSSGGLQSGCTPCPPGSVSQAGASGCSVCSGRIASRTRDVCVQCPPGSAPASGSVCAPCPTDTISNGSHCIPCPYGSRPTPDGVSCVDIGCPRPSAVPPIGRRLVCPGTVTTADVAPRERCSHVCVSSVPRDGTRDNCTSLCMNGGVWSVPGPHCSECVSLPETSTLVRAINVSGVYFTPAGAPIFETVNVWITAHRFDPRADLEGTLVYTTVIDTVRSEVPFPFLPSGFHYTVVLSARSFGSDVVLSYSTTVPAPPLYCGPLVGAAGSARVACPGGATLTGGTCTPRTCPAGTEPRAVSCALTVSQDGHAYASWHLSTPPCLVQTAVADLVAVLGLRNQSDSGVGAGAGAGAVVLNLNSVAPSSDVAVGDAGSVTSQSAFVLYGVSGTLIVLVAICSVHIQQQLHAEARSHVIHF